MSGCTRLATHKVFTTKGGEYLVCEECIKHVKEVVRSRRRWKNWTQTIAEKVCQCLGDQHESSSLDA